MLVLLVQKQLYSEETTYRNIQLQKKANRIAKKNKKNDGTDDKTFKIRSNHLAELPVLTLLGCNNKQLWHLELWCAFYGKRNWLHNRSPRPERKREMWEENA